MGREDGITRREALALGSAATLAAVMPGGGALARVNGNALYPEFASEMRLALVAMAELNEVRDKIRECHAKLVVLNPWGEESRTLQDWATHYWVAQLKAEERAALAIVRANRAAPPDDAAMRRLCTDMHIATWKDRVDADLKDWTALRQEWREKWHRSQQSRTGTIAKLNMNASVA